MAISLQAATLVHPLLSFAQPLVTTPTTWTRLVAPFRKENSSTLHCLVVRYERKLSKFSFATIDI